MEVFKLKRLRAVWIWGITIFTFQNIHAQVDETVVFNENTTSEQMEFWAELESSAESIILNKFHSQFHSLLPFNSSSPSQWKRYGGLSQEQIERIQAHKNQFGDFLSAVELLHCQIPDSLIFDLAQNFHFNPRFQLGNTPNTPNQKSQLIIGSAMENGRYFIQNTASNVLDSSNNPNPTLNFRQLDSLKTLSNLSYLKLKVPLNSFTTAGIAIQNDANEKWGDLINAYLKFQLKNSGFTWVIGKYLVMQNQGHVSTAPFPVGRLYAMESWQYSLQQIQGVGGFNEDVGFWGMALQYEILRSRYFHFNGITHAGYRKMDAVIRDSLGYFERQQWGGIHVSKTEQLRQNSVSQSTVFQSIALNTTHWNTSASIGLYRHSIPRKSQNQLKSIDVNVEWAASADFWRGKWNGSLAWDGTNFSKYLAAYYLWNSEVQWGWKYEHLPEHFYSVELSPNTYYNRGRPILTAGLDWKLNSSWQLKVRQTSQDYSFWGMALDGKILKHSTVQSRWEPQNHRIKLGINHKLNRNHEFRYQIQINDSFSSYPQFYSSCVWKFTSKWADFWFQYSQFQTQDELYYASIPSITQNWTSRVFSGSGQFLSVRLKCKIDPRVHLLIQCDWMKKKIAEPLNSQQLPRIFVQLNIQ
jgi:hypothetical protein